MSIDLAKRAARALLAVAVLTMFGGCTSSSRKTVRYDGYDNLLGIDWQLESFLWDNREINIPPRQQILFSMQEQVTQAMAFSPPPVTPEIGGVELALNTLEPTERGRNWRVWGAAGANTFQGSVATGGESFKFTQLLFTQVTGMPGATDFETLFKTALSQIDSYYIEIDRYGDMLLILTRSDNIELVFSPFVLMGRWGLSQVNTGTAMAWIQNSQNVPILPEITFNPEFETISIFAGVNNYIAKYQVNTTARTLEFTNVLRATKLSALNQIAAGVEQSFLELLSQTVYYTFDKQRLTFQNADSRNLLVFDRLVPLDSGPTPYTAPNELDSPPAEGKPERTNPFAPYLEPTQTFILQ